MTVRSRLAFYRSEHSKLGQRFLAAQSQSVRRLLQLNYDVLQLIFRQLDRKTLKSLACIFGNWRDAAMGELLRSIEYCAETDPVKTGLVGECERVKGETCCNDKYAPSEIQYCARDKIQTPTDIKNATHIRDITMLHHIVQREPSLRYLVKQAYLKRELDTCRQVDELCKWIDTESLQLLYVTGIPSRHARAKTDATPARRIKHIDMSDPQIRNDSIRLLRRLFEDQTIDTIHIDHFYHADESEWYNALPVNRLSPIKTLIFTDGAPDPDALYVMLSWTQRLSRLHLEIGDQRVLHEDQFSVIGVVDALIPTQAKHLEELFIGGTDGASYLEEMHPADFRPLTSLRSLEIMFRCLMDVPYTYDQVYISACMQISALPRHILPPSLEELTLRLDPDFGWSYPVSWQSIPRDFHNVPTHMAKGFMIWLSRLCETQPLPSILHPQPPYFTIPFSSDPSQPRCFPKLRRVCLMRQFVDRLDETPDADDWLYHPFVPDFWQKYEDKFKRRGIRLEAWVRDREETRQRLDVFLPGSEPEYGRYDDWWDGWEDLPPR